MFYVTEFVVKYSGLVTDWKRGGGGNTNKIKSSNISL